MSWFYFSECIIFNLKICLQQETCKGVPSPTAFNLLPQEPIACSLAPSCPEQSRLHPRHRMDSQTWPHMPSSNQMIRSCPTVQEVPNLQLSLNDHMVSPHWLWQPTFHCPVVESSKRTAGLGADDDSDQSPACYQSTKSYLGHVGWGRRSKCISTAKGPSSPHSTCVCTQIHSLPSQTLG